MDPQSEDEGNTDNWENCSVSSNSQYVCDSNWKVKSSSEDEGAEDFSVNSQPISIPESDNELEANSKTASEEHLSDEDIFKREQEGDRSTSSESYRPSLLSPMTPPHSIPSPGSSPDSDLTLALPLTSLPSEGVPRVITSYKNCGGTESSRVESSEEGGRNDAPPACVSFGISEEGAEQAQRWDSGSDTDLCRPNRHRGRHTRLSQSERHVKETKSKCKRIALLLTNAPNPRNRGALLFKKRRQRVENYTFISYGTGHVDCGDQIEEEAEELTEYDSVESTDSELEGEYSVHYQKCQQRLDWESLHKMESLPETQGKGALMFAQRRKRMDEIVSEHEELRSKGLPVEGVPKLESPAPPNNIDTNETNVHNDEVSYADTTQEADNLESSPNAPKPLVPNRTAKPFLGFQVPAISQHSVVKPVTPVKKKPEHKFKVPVPVPITTNPHVWSPTADVIASRDERISVPAIKTGILPEAKRKGKQSPPEQKTNLQNKGDRRSFIECEEDCFSLGAEACNFMQPTTIKLKNPPPVAPKPSINPACPPWMVSGALDDPYAPLRSSQPPPTAKHQQMPNHWAQDQVPAKLQTPTNMASQLHPQPTGNSWSLQQSRSPVSMQTYSPTYSPQPPPSESRNKTANTVASYSPQKEDTVRGQAGTLAGRGAEMFSKRQSRMEKFVVDAETKQANKPRDPSPTSSLPNSWRYSSNIRAPPPVAYNPLLAPFYPPAAAKQPPSTSPKIKPKQTKQKPKPAKKHLNALDIMKHQPYQLDTSLFKYEPVTETKTPSPKPSPKPTKSVPKRFKHKPAPPRSPQNILDIETTKSTSLVGSPGSDAHKSPAGARTVDKNLNENLSVSPVLNHINSKQGTSNRPASVTSQHSSISSISDSIAAFSPASLIARGVRQMAPRPKFSAKRQVEAGKQWKPVAMQL